MNSESKDAANPQIVHCCPHLFQRFFRALAAYDFYTQIPRIFKGKSSYFHLLFIACFWLILLGCSATKKLQKEVDLAVGFYNVENLFDIIDDPITADEEFTPTGRLQWTQERYAAKLTSLSKVIQGMGLPSLMGLAEVENAKVAQDLAATPQLSPAEYDLVHYESPDGRGIDVALLYNKEVFNVVHSSYIRIQFPAALILTQFDSTTRDVLHAELLFNKKDTLHVLVTHLPSRVGGEKETEPRRIFVAQQIRKRVDDLFRSNPLARILIMGDFNDETDNTSIASVLKAIPLNNPMQPSTLYNFFSTLDDEGKGTYNFRGNWNMLDQIIVSSSLLDRKNRLHFTTPQIFQQDWMMYEDKNNGKTPNRTYGGERYFGGVSDHLPVIIRR
jgi:endonuclease/exonuclease/phosphatase family metal-dependent hydrolase